MKKEKCKAKTLKGNPCPYDVVLKGYCLKHFQMYIIKKKKPKYDIKN